MMNEDNKVLQEESGRNHAICKKNTNRAIVPLIFLTRSKMSQNHLAPKIGETLHKRFLNNTQIFF